MWRLLKKTSEESRKSKKGINGGSWLRRGLWLERREMKI
jgi:hypothetical protein